MHKIISYTPICLQTLLSALCAVIAFAGAVSAQSVIQQPSGGATWYVDATAEMSGDGTAPTHAVKTIPEGLALAAAGDTVAVASGVYTGVTPYVGAPNFVEPIRVPPRVSLVGAGVGKSIIQGPTAGHAIVELAFQSSLEGFTIRSDPSSPSVQGVQAGEGGTVVLHNRIEGTAGGISAGCELGTPNCTEPIVVAFNVVAGSAMEGIRVTGDMTTTVRSNTVFSERWALWLESQSTIVEGNLLMAEGGVYCDGAGIIFRHNNTQSGNYYSGYCPEGEADTAYDPLLRDPASSDFRLTAGSPLRGRSADGSDIGALPFVPVGQAPPTVTMTSIGANQVRVDWASTGADGYDVFISDAGAADGISTRRHFVSASTSLVLTRDNPLISPIVAVSSVDGGGNGSELTKAPRVEPLVLRNATIEQDSPLIWVGGGWQPVQDAGASGGSYLVNTSPSARIQVVFEGDTVVLGRRVGPDGGYARLTVDGVQRGSVSFQFVEQRWRVPATLSGFGPGTHLLVLEPDPYRQPSSGGINLDFAMAPSSSAPSAAQVQAVDRVNLYRATAGLSSVRGDLAMHQGAQAHSEYYARNRMDPRLAGLGFHREHPDLPGYTGKTSSDRDRYFGYPGGAGEDGHFLGDPIRSVDGWMATVYHRNLIMCYTCTDMGYGVFASKDNNVDTLNMGSTTWSPPDERFIYTYPASNQTNVVRSWDGGEIPNPLPGLPRPVGYPISLYIEQDPQQGQTAVREASAPEEFVVRDAATVQESVPQWSVTTAELLTAGGAQVPIYMLDQNTDVPKYLGPDVVFLIPHKPLAEDTTYVAHIAGTDSMGVPFDQRWVFATGSTVAAPNFASDAGVGGSAVPPSRRDGHGAHTSY